MVEGLPVRLALDDLRYRLIQFPRPEQRVEVRRSLNLQSIAIRGPPISSARNASRRTYRRSRTPYQQILSRGSHCGNEPAIHIAEVNPREPRRKKERLQLLKPFNNVNPHMNQGSFTGPFLKNARSEPLNGKHEKQHIFIEGRFTTRANHSRNHDGSATANVNAMSYLPLSATHPASQLSPFTDPPSLSNGLQPNRSTARRSCSWYRAKI